VVDHFPSAEYRAIRARVPLASERIAGDPEVTFIRTAIPAKTNRTVSSESNLSRISTGVIGPVAFIRARRKFSSADIRGARGKRSQPVAPLDGSASSPGGPFIGKATSSGDKAHQADTAKSQYGYSGEGSEWG